MPRQLATARSKTKTKPRRVKRALHRSPATPGVHEPDFVPDPATRPRQRSIWHEVDADPAPDAAPKDNGHDGLQPLFLRLCFGKQLRLARAALPRSRQSLLTRQVRRCLSYFSHLLDQLVLSLSTMPLEHQTPSPAYAAPGPKSGRDCTLMPFHCRGLRLVIFFLQASRSLSAIVPEPRVGGTGGRHPPEAVHFDTYRTAHTAKPSDSSFTTSRVSVYPAFATSYRKRAYTRALSRANRCGSTMYRGQRIYGSRPPGLQPSADQHRPAPSTASQVRQAARLHFLSWNSGGLSSERYQQLALWLRTAGQHIGIVAVQETHWSQDLSFHMDGWLALTSPCLDKVSGILLLVNLRHFHRHHVQFTSVLDGRLVHLRLEGEPSTDVLVGYQHLYASSKAAPGAAGLEQSLAKRNIWWTKLHQTLSRFPARNSVLVVGDFNTDLFPDVPFVGQGARARLSRMPPDQPEFQQLLHTFSLQALNTFGRAGLPAQTFLPAVGERGTQIDFALARRSLADGPARHVPDPLGCPLLRRRASGIFHSLAPYHCLSPLKADLFRLGPRGSRSPSPLFARLFVLILNLRPAFVHRHVRRSLQLLLLQFLTSCSERGALVPRLTLLCLPALVRADS